MLDKTVLRTAVVIPVYRAHYLAECLASVIAQTLPPDEIIVVDDGSPDRDVLARAVAVYGDRIRLLEQANLGAGAARNRGVLATDAGLIAFLDADDVWTPTLLEKQTRRICEMPGCTLAYANATVIGDGPLRGLLFMDTAPSCGEVTVEALLGQRCTVLTSSVVVRRSALLDAGLFDAALRRGQDFDMWVRLAARGARFTYTTEALLERRIHAHNLSGDRVAELERARTVLGGLATKLTLTREAAHVLDLRIRRLQGEIDAEQGKRSLSSGDVTAAIEHFRRAAEASVGWKSQLVSMALRIAPELTRQAYLLKTRGQSAQTLSGAPLSRVR